MIVLISEYGMMQAWPDKVEKGVSFNSVRLALDGFPAKIDLPEGVTLFGKHHKKARCYYDEEGAVKGRPINHVARIITGHMVHGPMIFFTRPHFVKRHEDKRP